MHHEKGQLYVKQLVLALRTDCCVLAALLFRAAERLASSAVQGL